MTRRKRKKGVFCTVRAGTTLVELLGVMAVITIVAGVAIGGVITAQNKARITSARSSVDSYEAAFTTACITHPGIVSDRRNTWTGESSYTSEEGLKRLVFYMNEYLDDNLDLYWDPTDKCFVSYGADPWGGNYVLTEYPELAGTESKFDPTAPGNTGEMCAALWLTGNVESIVTGKKVTEETYGAAFCFTGGVVDTHYQGFEDEFSYTEYTIRLQ